MKCTTFLLLCIFSILTYRTSAETHALHAKKQGSGPITHFVIFSERCSGSNYLHDLILFNLEMKEANFCHKHFPPWHELSQESYYGDPRHYTFDETDDTLFIVLFRNPYDWARSLHKNPWHAADHLRKIPFSDFIRTPWELLPPERDWLVRNCLEANPLLDKNPYDGSPFSNIFELRSAKIRTMLQILYKAKNSYCLNYETVRDNPEGIIQEIENIFTIKAKERFEPVIKYVGGIRGNGLYLAKPYPQLSSDDLFYINTQLDVALERSIGYSLYFSSEEVDLHE